MSTQRYTPFGELRNNANLDTDRLYTGQVFDEATGLAFYNARYYDPAIGRFASPDSIVPNPLNGQDYNRYSYVRNNPIRFQDPSGHCVWDASCPVDELTALATDVTNLAFAPAGLRVAGSDGCSAQTLAETHPELVRGIVNASGTPASVQVPARALLGSFSFFAHVGIYNVE